ncbi:MAG: hypothetical protein VKL39_13100, partial [Leptolyngbyaceae bacterium]|nr:hypothetical protein [Leptolyngbyaceae bacterium]
MTDHREQLFQKTRIRSSATGRYAFEFISPYEKTVFPIMQRFANGTSQLAGTGFFIAPGGIFLSAAHVFEIDVSNKDSFWTVIQDTENSLVELDFEEVRVRPDNRDIAVGKIDMQGLEHPIVSIMELMPEVNEVIATFVFSQTLVHKPTLNKSVLMQHI